MEQQTNLKLYMWRFQSKYTIFVIAESLEDARVVAVAKAGGSLKEQVLRVVENEKPSVYDERHSFIFEVGAQLIG